MVCRQEESSLGTGQPVECLAALWGQEAEGWALSLGAAWSHGEERSHCPLRRTTERMHWCAASASLTTTAAADAPRPPPCPGVGCGWPGLLFQARAQVEAETRSLYRLPPSGSVSCAVPPVLSLNTPGPLMSSAERKGAAPSKLRKCSERIGRFCSDQQDFQGLGAFLALELDL